MRLETLLDLIRQRRTTRGFVPSELTDEQARTLVEAARFAPTGGNSQPWEFVFVCGKANREAVIETLERAREGFQAAHPNHHVTAKAYLQNASALVAVLGDPRCDPRLGLSDVLKYPDPRDYRWPEYMFFLGIGAAVENLLLAATAMGLGGVWLTTDVLDLEDQLRRLLGVPEPLRVVSLIAVGRPSKDFPIPFKRETDRLLHLERYDPAKMRTDAEILAVPHVLAGRIGRRSMANGH